MAENLWHTSTALRCVVLWYKNSDSGKDFENNMFFGSTVWHASAIFGVGSLDYMDPTAKKEMTASRLDMSDSVILSVFQILLICFSLGLDPLDGHAELYDAPLANINKSRFSAPSHCHSRKPNLLVLDSFENTLQRGRPWPRF